MLKGDNDGPPPNTETFSFGYTLIKSGGTYTLVDANPGSSGVNPVANGIELVDPNGSAPIDHGDKFKIDAIASGSLSTTGG